MLKQPIISGSTPILTLVRISHRALVLLQVREPLLQLSVRNDETFFRRIFEVFEKVCKSWKETPCVKIIVGICKIILELFLFFYYLFGTRNVQGSRIRFMITNELILQ